MKKVALFVALFAVCFTATIYVYNYDVEFASKIDTALLLLRITEYRMHVLALTALFGNFFVYTIVDVAWAIICDIYKLIRFIYKKVSKKQA